MRQGLRLAGLVLALGLGLGEGNARIVVARQPATDHGYLTAQSAGGQNVAQDNVAVLERYRLGASQGDSASLNGLAGLLEKGSGVPVDVAKAYALFHIAASMPGADPSQAALGGQSRDALSVKMSTAQFARAEQLLALCYGNDINRCSESILASGDAAVASLNTPAARDGRSVTAGGKTVVQLEQANGVYVVPVVVNGIVNMKFAIDTGATDVSIPADVVAALTKAGSIVPADFLDKRTYILADGSKVPSQTFRLRSLKVGDVTVENVRASIAPENSPSLLGQSFFGRLKSWSLNNTLHALIME